MNINWFGDRRLLPLATVQKKQNQVPMSADKSTCLTAVRRCTEFDLLTSPRTVPATRQDLPSKRTYLLSDPFKANFVISWCLIFLFFFSFPFFFIYMRGWLGYIYIYIVIKSWMAKAILLFLIKLLIGYGLGQSMQHVCL